MPSKATPRTSTGRVTPKKGGPAAAPGPQWELEQSRQVSSPWGWRIMLFLSLVGVGIGLVLLGNHYTTMGLLWMVIAAGWFGFATMLWRKHARFMRRR